MLHCHMMNHEDLGMMQVVEVYADDKWSPPAGRSIRRKPNSGMTP